MFIECDCLLPWQFIKITGTSSVKVHIALSRLSNGRFSHCSPPRHIELYHHI